MHHTFYDVLLGKLDTKTPTVRCRMEKYQLALEEWMVCIQKIISR